MSLINISNLTFAYDGSYDNVFEDVSFQIDTNWRLGLTGRNGRGKTTFLKLLLGKYEYSGAITSDVRFLYFPFEVCDKTALTAEVAAGVCPAFEMWELERELSLLDLDIDVLGRRFDTLSGGEQTKVLLASLFLGTDGYLLIDEPTNHLDSRAREAVSRYLKSKRSFILVSHDRAFLDECTSHTLSINKTGIEIQRGNFSSWLENKERRDSFELSENAKLKKDIDRLKAAARRTSDWSGKTEKSKKGAADKGFVGHKAAKMMSKSKNIESRQNRAIDEKSGLLKNLEEAESLKIHPLVYTAKRLVTFDNVSAFYDSTRIFGSLSFDIEQGERVALRGGNGSGKTSIIKLICGEDIEHTGCIKKGSNLVISYVSQDTSHLRGDLTDFAKSNGLDESLFKAILRKLDFSRVQFEKDMHDFSSGGKKKVLIAKSLCERAHLYIWDEPLNYIDVLSRIQIEKLLLQYKPTMLFVEHDKAFADAIATKNIEL